MMYYHLLVLIMLRIDTFMSCCIKYFVNQELADYNRLWHTKKM